jgi:hypothetical protein
MVFMQNKLSIQDFTFVGGDRTISPSYQYGPFAIHVGERSYHCTYSGLTFSFGHKSIAEAVAACNQRAKNGPVLTGRRLGSSK